MLQKSFAVTSFAVAVNVMNIAKLRERSFKMEEWEKGIKSSLLLSI
ncbi:hypothetical protein [Pseudogracilibacillus sp. ICA-222130]